MSSVIFCFVINIFSYFISAESDTHVVNNPTSVQLCFQAQTFLNHGYHHAANRQCKTRKLPFAINAHIGEISTVLRMASEDAVDFHDAPEHFTRASFSLGGSPPDLLDRLGEDNLLPDRRQRLERAVQGRMQGLRVVLDGVGDPRNRAAV